MARRRQASSGRRTTSPASRQRRNWKRVDPTKSWLIGTVTYMRDEGGQHAHLSLWPKEAFTVEPTTLNMLVTNEAVNNANPTKPNADAKPAPATPGHVLLRPDQLEL